MVDLPAPDGPTMATIFPAGTSKLTCFRIWPLRIVSERDVLELDLALGDVKRLGARAIEDLGRFLQQSEHRLDVDQPLLDLAIDHAHEIERQ